MEELKLSYRHVTEESVNAVADSIIGGKLVELRSLDLSATFCPIPMVFMSLTTALATNPALVPHLRTLSLVGIDIDIQYAAEVVVTCRTLVEADLTGHIMTEKGAGILSQAMQGSATGENALQRLRISLCAPHLADPLIQALPEGPRPLGDLLREVLAKAGTERSEGKVARAGMENVARKVLGYDATVLESKNLADLVQECAAELGVPTGQAGKGLRLEVHCFLTDFRNENVTLVITNKSTQRQPPGIFRAALKAFSQRLSADAKKRPKVWWSSHIWLLADLLAHDHTTYAALHTFLHAKETLFFETISDLAKSLGQSADQAVSEQSEVPVSTVICGVQVKSQPLPQSQVTEPSHDADLQELLAGSGSGKTRPTTQAVPGSLDMPSLLDEGTRKKAQNALVNLAQLKNTQALTDLA